MGQRIGDYKNTLSQMQKAGTDQAAIGQDGQGKIGLREPLKPPSGWTKFKAALSNLPGLGGFQSLQQARAEVASYPVRLQQYQVQSREIMAGFMRSMRSEYGDQVAGMATRSLDQTGTTPLTGRTVRTVLADAEKAKASTQASNRFNLMRFMESGVQGGFGRMPGETDMVGVMFERGMHMPEGATGFKDFLGEKAGGWVENYMNKRVQEHPLYGTGRIPNEELVAIANEALDFVAEAQSLGLPADKLDAVFEAATKDTENAQKQTDLLREFSTRESFIYPKLDRKDPDSMLRQSAQRIAQEHGMPPFTDGVLKSISNNMAEHLCFGFKALPEHIHCESDTHSIQAALEPVMKSKVEALLHEHCEALAMIESSTVLSEPQKAALRNIASQRRMDPTQVRTYEKFANQLKTGMGEFRAAIAGQNAVVMGRTLLDLKTTFEQGLQAMLQHGDVNWEAGSLSGGEKTTELMGEMVQVGLADLSAEAKKQLFGELTSDSACGALTGFRMSPDMALAAQVPLVHAVITDIAGRGSGLEKKDVDAGMRRLGEDAPQQNISPMAALIGAGSQEEGGTVDPSSKHRGLVSKAFSGDAYRAAHGAEWAQFVSEGGIDQNTGLSSAFDGDIGRARFYVNGRMISDVGQTSDPAKAETHAQFLQAFTHEGVVDMNAAKAVSLCLNQRGVNNPMVGMMQEALGGGALMGHSASTYEAWQDPDGSWNVRTTAKLGTEHYMKPDADRPEELGGNGYMLASVTYHISGESIAQGNPQIQVADSRTYFSF